MSNQLQFRVDVPHIHSTGDDNPFTALEAALNKYGQAQNVPIEVPYRSSEWNVEIMIVGGIIGGAAWDFVKNVWNQRNEIFQAIEKVIKHNPHSDFSLVFAVKDGYLLSLPRLKDERISENDLFWLQNNLTIILTEKMISAHKVRYVVQNDKRYSVVYLDKSPRPKYRISIPDGIIEGINEPTIEEIKQSIFERVKEYNERIKEWQQKQDEED